jgi:chitosanase
VITDLQKRTCQAIINIFETSRALGDYASTVFHPQDPGQLTYGRSQTTLASGNLFLLIKSYCAASGAQFADELRPFLPPLAERNSALNTDMTLRNLLRAAGADPVMHDVQDAFFDRVYWEPAVRSTTSLGLSTALGTATVYDSTVHGSWPRIRDQTIASAGSVSTLGEHAWVGAYIATRRNWLATQPNTLLQRTVYRTDALQALVNAGAWELPLPFNVRGVRLDADLLQGNQPVVVSAEVIEQRLLRLQAPLMQGEDVRQIQAGLGRAGFAVSIDGVYGPETENAVRAFQRQGGLVSDGIVGQATRTALVS